MKARIALFVFLLLALPLSGFSQSTLNFPRVYTAQDLGSTGFAFVNPGPTAASMTFTLYSLTGATVSTSTPQTIPAGGQIAKLGTELFSNVGSGGWIKGTSTTTGITGFWLGGDFGTYTDGAEAAPPGQEFVFPLATATTELSVANLASSANTITIRVYDATGTALPLASTTVTSALPTNGAYKSTLAAAFPGVNFSNAMYVRVTGTGVMAATTLITDFLYAPSWSVINGIDTSSNVNEAYFAHAYSETQSGVNTWVSTLGVANLSTSSNTLTITYTTTAGVATTVTRTLNGRGAIRETVKDMFGFGNGTVDGWVRVSGTGPIAGMLALGYAAAKGVAIVPMQLTPQSQYTFAHVAQDSGWGSGIAMLNPTGTPATIEVYILQPSGALVGGALDATRNGTPSATFTLAPGSMDVHLLNEYVPASNSNGGFVYLRSSNNVPLYAYELFFRSALDLISNVAAGVIDPSITYTPPAPSGSITPLPSLTITTLSPASAARSGTLTITGTGFSTTAASNTVYFATATGSTSVAPTVATATSLTVTVPATAISGPVYVTVGSRSTNARVLQVSQSATALATPASVTVTASNTTRADIYVASPTGTALNITGFGIDNVNTLSGVTISEAAKSVTASSSSAVNRWLWIEAGAVDATASVSISGSGVTVTEIQNLTAPAGYRVVQITVAAGTAAGVRNIILTNTNLNTSIITGGLVIQ